MRDAETRTYGAPDLLIRSDVLADLFPRSITPEAAEVSAPDLGDPGWHYLTQDIRAYKDVDRKAMMEIVRHLRATRWARRTEMSE